MRYAKDLAEYPEEKLSYRKLAFYRELMKWFSIQHFTIFFQADYHQENPDWEGTPCRHKHFDQINFFPPRILWKSVHNI